MADYVGPLLILAFAPGIFWLWYFYHRDRYEPEPLSWIFRMFLIGMAITLPVALIEAGVGLLFPEVFLAVVAAPVIEELSKYEVVRRFVYNTIEFNEPIDGIIYATAVALGFATVENVSYVLMSYQQSLALAVDTGLFRAVLSVPGHALFSSMWGFALGQAKFSPPARRGVIIAQGLILAILFHGIFNFLLMDNIGVAVLILAFVPAMWWLVNRRINQALAQFHPNNPAGTAGK
jgi:RsiW-degrading membrane proteinase PrsW (M82 family)